MLDAQLSSLSHDACCMAVGSSYVSVGDLRRAATVLRARLPMVAGSCIALCGLSTQMLIEALVAFDGLTQQMLLLPASLDRDTQQSLIKTAQCTYVLNADGECTQVGSSEKKAIDPEMTETRWLLATSGTTGTPKIISHSLNSLTRTTSRNITKGTNYIWGLLYDPCRFAGLQVVLQSLLGGSRLAVPQTNTFEDQVKALLEHQINALSATPSLWRKMLMDGRVRSLSLKQITIGGEIADQQLLDVLRSGYPEVRIVHIYASTEAGTGFAVQDGKAGFPSVWLNDSASPISLRINGDDHLLIKPPELPLGEEIRGRLDSDGYLDTQDIVQKSGERVYFLGRASGAINVGGNKVHPEEVEKCIRQVSGVGDARVFAKSNSMMGQLVAAEVVIIDGFDQQALRQQIQVHCRSRLEPWQRPAFVVIVDSLRETAAGKKKRVNQ